jgi:hypothetical protein
LATSIKSYNYTAFIAKLTLIGGVVECVRGVTGSTNGTGCLVTEAGNAVRN